MNTIPADLLAFLDEPCDSREYRRALALKCVFQGYAYAVIADMLGVTLGFISHAKKAYETHGVAGFRLKYQGTIPYLTDEERANVIMWLKAQAVWSVELLRIHVEETYGVVFQSNQSYYQLLADAEITYKKAQMVNPKRDDARVAEKKKPSKRH